MNKFLLKLTPEWSLRVGLGLMYIYSGVDIIRHPTAWFWALRPLLKWFPLSMQASWGTPEAMTGYLMFQGAGELILAFIFLAWFLPKYAAKWAAAVSVLEFAGILILIPVDAITFRDIGLLGAFVALWLMLAIDNSSRAGYGINTESARSAQRAQDKQAPGGPSVETFEEFMGQK